LFDRQSADYRMEALTLGPANRAAWTALTQTHAWPGGAFALIGPSGAGKTHMAHAFGAGVHALMLDRRAPHAHERQAGGPIVIDRADACTDEAGLAQALDWARAGDGLLLLVGQAAPTLWPMHMQDVRSRLSALAIVRLEEPDDTILEAVLHQQARARFLKLTPEAARYLMRHMERSYAGAMFVADVLADHCRSPSRPISEKTASAILRQVRPDWPDAPGDGEPE
jgi:chromosomal replication initiation ATPase DnaA